MKETSETAEIVKLRNDVERLRLTKEEIAAISEAALDDLCQEMPLRGAILRAIADRLEDSPTEEERRREEDRIEGLVDAAGRHVSEENRPTVKAKEDAQFVEHLEQASRTVQSWPMWKQTVLGEMGPASPRAEFQALIDKHPLLFARDHKGRHFNFRCDEGWINILSCLLDLISERLKTLEARGLSDDGSRPEFKFFQIKEKFGGLRIHTDGYSDEFILGAVDVARRMSYKTCEVTGRPGFLCKKGSWVKTLCDEKAEELGYSKFPEKLPAWR